MTYHDFEYTLLNPFFKGSLFIRFFDMLYELITRFPASIDFSGWTGRYSNVFHYRGDRWHLIVFTAVAAQGTIAVVETSIYQRSAQAHLHSWAKWRDQVTWYEEVGQVKQVNKHFVAVTKSKKSFWLKSNYKWGILTYIPVDNGKLKP